MPLKIVVATGNRHKVREIAAILKPAGFEPVCAMDVGEVPEVIEDGRTFEANAMKKATMVASALGKPVIADDSGLVVTALNGRPGVFSARYAGTGATDAANVKKLLGELEDCDFREGKFVCVIAVSDASGECLGTVRGEVSGTIIRAARGGNGFGYDPVFVPTGHEQTFAELPAEVKNAMSHRGKALNNMVASRLLERLRPWSGPRVSSAADECK